MKPFQPNRCRPAPVSHLGNELLALYNLANKSVLNTLPTAHSQMQINDNSRHGMVGWRDGWVRQPGRLRSLREHGARWKKREFTPHFTNRSWVFRDTKKNLFTNQTCFIYYSLNNHRNQKKTWPRRVNKNVEKFLFKYWMFFAKISQALAQYLQEFG